MRLNNYLDIYYVSFACSYETADGTRVAESGVLREVPVQVASPQPDPVGAPLPPAPTNPSEQPSPPGTRLANSVSGGYSYTAPDGTFVSLRSVQ